MEISYDSEDEQYDSRVKQKFNFLAKKTSKSKRKFNIDPFVLIEHLLSDHEDDDQEVEDDDIASIEDDDWNKMLTLMLQNLVMGMTILIHQT